MPISKVVKISVISPHEIVTETLEEDPFVSSTAHILKIDLDVNEGDAVTTGMDGAHVLTGQSLRRREAISKAEDVACEAFLAELAALQAEQSSYPPITNNFSTYKPELEVRNKMLIRRLRKLVAEDRNSPPDSRVDALVLGPDPQLEHYQALDGLSPKHIDLCSGFMETVDAQPITYLFHPWNNIESAIIRGECSGWHERNLSNAKGSTTDPDTTYFPEFISPVKSLALVYCLNFSFEAKNLPVNMVNFKVIGNDAMATFCLASTNIPGFLQRLERLHLLSASSICETEETSAFRQALSECTKIRHLFLALGDMPPNISTGDSPDTDEEFDYGFPPDEKGEDYSNSPDSPQDSYFHPEFEDGSDNDTRWPIFFPQSVETLSFHCSTSDAMLADLDYWIEDVAKQDWLPNLKSISIRPDGPQLENGKHLKPTTDTRRLADFQTKIEKIYDILKARMPRVTIIA